MQVLQQWEALKQWRLEDSTRYGPDREFAKKPGVDECYPQIADSGRALMNEALRLLPLSVFGSVHGLFGSVPRLLCLCFRVSCPMRVQSSIM